MHHFTFWAWIISRFNGAWPFWVWQSETGKIWQIGRVRHKTSKPKMASVVSFIPTGGCLFIAEIFKTFAQQESRPAWTQEAYRPRRIKYSICFPKWGTPRQGYPSARSDGGYLRRGTPQLGLMGGTWGGVAPSRGYPPSQVWWGVPKVGPPHQGYPCQVWWGVPEVGYPPARSDREYPRWGIPSKGYPPPPGWTWLGYPPSPPAGPGPGWGTPLGVDRQMDG